MTRILRLAVVVALAIVGAVGPAAPSGHAATAGCDTSWKRSVDGDWNDAANWTNGVPLDNRVCIRRRGTYTVTLTAPGYGLAASVLLGDAASAPTLDLEATCRPKGGPSELVVDDQLSIGPHATLAMSYSQCDDSVEVNTDHGTVVNHGVIDVGPMAGGHRTFIPPVFNKGTVRLAATASIEAEEGINDSPSSVTEVHVDSQPIGNETSPTGAEHLAGTLAIVTDPGFTPTLRQTYGVCIKCDGRFHTITGSQVAPHVVLHPHYFSAPDGYPQLYLKTQRN